MGAPKLDESWGAMTWEGAARNTLVAGSQLTLAEKVAWLEEAHYVAVRLGALPDRAETSKAGSAPQQRQARD